MLQVEESTSCIPNLNPKSKPEIFNFRYLVVTRNVRISSLNTSLSATLLFISKCDKRYDKTQNLKTNNLVIYCHN